MDRSFTFRITLPDGTHVDEVVTLDFSDIPFERKAEIIQEADLQQPLDITSRLLHEKLETDVPVEVLRSFLEALQQGEGVTLGTSS